MMALLLCGLLLLSPADTVPVATPPPTEAEDVIEAVDLAPWDDLFSRMEDGEAWQRPSALVRSIAAGEEDPARLLAWLKELGLSGVSEAAGLCLVALGPSSKRCWTGRRSPPAGSCPWVLPPFFSCASCP